jgi:tetratricopeptide (TPR) repeat protein
MNLFKIIIFLFTPLSLFSQSSVKDLVSKGNKLFFSKKYDEALGNFNSAILLEPKNASHHSARADVYLKLGKKDLAQTDIDLALEINPNDYRAYVVKGLLLASEEKHSEAMKSYNRAIELNPQGGYAYFIRGTLKYGLRDMTGGLKDIDKGILLQPNNSFFHLMRGFLRLNNEKFDLAIEDLDKAIQLDSGCGEAYSFRGMAKCFKKDRKGGCADLRKAGELGYMEAFEAIREFCE